MVSLFLLSNLQPVNYGENNLNAAAVCMFRLNNVKNYYHVNFHALTKSDCIIIPTST